MSCRDGEKFPTGYFILASGRVNKMQGVNVPHLRGEILRGGNISLERGNISPRKRNHFPLGRGNIYPWEGESIPTGNRKNFPKEGEHFLLGRGNIVPLQGETLPPILTL